MPPHAFENKIAKGVSQIEQGLSFPRFSLAQLLSCFKTKNRLVFPSQRCKLSLLALAIPAHNFFFYLSNNCIFHIWNCCLSAPFSAFLVPSASTHHSGHSDLLLRVLCISKMLGATLPKVIFLKDLQTGTLVPFYFQTSPQKKSELLFKFWAPWLDLDHFALKVPRGPENVQWQVSVFPLSHKGKCGEART